MKRRPATHACVCDQMASGSGKRVHSAREPALVSRGGVVVNDALLGGLVDGRNGLREQLSSRLDVAPVNGRAQPFDLGLELREISLITGPLLETLSHVLQG